MEQRLLTVNTGSSSLKAALYDAVDPPLQIAALDITRIGTDARVGTRWGSERNERSERVADHFDALSLLLRWLEERRLVGGLVAVGHRIVHGGARFSAPQTVTNELLSALRDLMPIDPMHLPQAIAAIVGLRQADPDLPQIACFDTAFHRGMPAVAQTYPLPLEYRDLGVIRYGFHGLSYEYIMSRLQTIAPSAARGRVIIAHLGNGASMAAVRDGRGIDTTMGFTPTGGLVMGTRTGDLDPGVLLYLMQERGLSPAEANDLVTSRSGLLGVSGSTSDMQDLLGRRAQDQAAALAVDLFCYWARKYIGALTAVLGGLDTLIFTGGIGEHAAPVRADICRGLEFMGITLDQAKNAENEAVVSAAGAAVTVRVMATDEDAMIARHTQRVLASRGGTGVSV